MKTVIKKTSFVRIALGRIVIAACGLSLLALSGCGGGGGGVGAPQPGGDIGGGSTYTVGGTVTGLSTSESVTLLNKGGNPLTVTANGGFTFSGTHNSRDSYEVTVQSRTPGLSCSVSNGSGNLASANVANIAVLCNTASVSVLSAFTNEIDGANPQAALVIDGNGNLFGTTNNGGLYNGGTVFKLSPNGSGYSQSILYSFRGGADGMNPRAGVILDSSGNLYGTTSGGGSTGNGTVFKLSASASGYSKSTLFSFTGMADGGAPMAALVMDSSGSLYGTTLLGGAADHGTVFKLTPSGGSYNHTTLYAFGSVSNDGWQPLAPLTLDSAGNLYGTTSFGGVANRGTVFKLSLSGSTYSRAILYEFAGGADGADPESAIVIDGVGNLYGTTKLGGLYDWGTVFKLRPNGDTYTKSLLYLFTGDRDGGKPTAGVIMDSAGNLFGTTTDGVDAVGTVFKLAPNGSSYIQTTLCNFDGVNGATPYASLLMDRSGNLYGTNYGAGQANVGTVFKLGN